MEKCKMKGTRAVQERKIALVVDDDEDFLFQQKALLERLGFDVVTAGGREEATAKLAEVQPALAVVDLMMEEKDGGFVLARHIKRVRPGTFVILVTAVTAETGLEFAVDAAEQRRWIQADALLAKPVRFEQLKREIERMPA
jgi:CheY-like chemotaxis protein